MYKFHLNNKSIYSITKNKDKDKLGQKGLRNTILYIIRTMTNPHSKFISLVSGNPCKKRQIIFKCPLTIKYKYGRDWDKERIDGSQDHRNRARIVVAWAQRDGQIKTVEEGNDEVNMCYELIKECENEERNKVQINPEWEQWNTDNKTERVSKPKKTNGKDNNRYEQLEQKNKDLLEQIELLTKQLKDKDDEIETLVEDNRELDEDKTNLEYQLEHEYISIDEYNEVCVKNDELKKELNQPTEPKVKNTNKGKKYNTKNKVIDEVLDEIVNELDNELTQILTDEDEDMDL